jgi:hypothetical protein
VSWGSSFGGGDTCKVESKLAACNISKIVSNGNSYTAVCSDGSAVSWGHSSYGGDTSKVESKLAVCNISKMVSNPYSYTAVCSDGSAVSWGNSLYGGDTSKVESKLAACNISKIFSNPKSYTAVCSDGSAVSWGNSGYGGDQGRAADFLQSGISSIFSNSGSFIAIKDSDLVKPPAGCAVWQYSSRAALIFSATAKGGVCGEDFKCLCAACNTTFEGEVSSLAPGNYSLLISAAEEEAGGVRCQEQALRKLACNSTFEGEVSSLAPGNYSLLISTAEEEAGGVRCQEQALRELACNSNEGYERVWDNERKQVYCRLSLSHICQTAKVMVEGNELKGSPMVARIRETTALTVRLPAGNSAKVELRPVQPVSATAEVDGKGLSNFALSTTGKFELHLVNGQSSCKLPSDLTTRCGAGYHQKDAACVPDDPETNMQIVQGVAMGIMLLLCAGLFAFFVRKNPGMKNRHAWMACAV